MKVTNTLNFDGSVVESENFNSSFYKVKMKVFAFGDNRNGSNFSPTSFSEKTQQSISLIPIVAKYNADEDDLEGHNVKLKKDSNGEYEFHFDTYPFGVVSNDNNITLEEVNEGTEDAPDIKTYVIVDNIYLWKRYDATKRIISWLEEGVSPKVSMEIDNVQGQFSDNGYFQIESFEFQAITALGSDVEPCFPRAEIATYSKQDFKEEFKALVYELNETLKIDQQGGTGMEDNQPKVEETPEVETINLAVSEDGSVLLGSEDAGIIISTPQETIETPEVASATFSEDGLTISGGTIETQETPVVEVFEATEVETEVEEETLPTQEFALTANQLRDQLRAELGKEHYHDTWGDKCRKYYLIDSTDALVIFENTQENYQLYAAPYAVNGDNVELNLADAYKVKVEYVAFEGNQELFAINSERFSVEQSTLQAELKGLVEYKRNREEEDLQAKFADKLSTEEFAQVFTDMKESELDKVEEKLFALIGKKNFTVSKPATQVNKVSFSLPKEENEEFNPYGDIFDK